MTKKLYPILFLVVLLVVSCEDSPRDISTSNYSGRVYSEKPNHKDISFVPSDNDIIEFEKQLNIDLDNVLSESVDTLVQRNKTKILTDTKKFKRRYYGVPTIESQKMLIVNFIHPDCLTNESQWRDSLWFPNLDNYTWFSIHYYLDDKSLFNPRLINYSH